MFRRNTVFVVGAGASAEFGLPLGNGLKDTIADKANIQFSEFSKLITGNAILAGALQETVPPEKLQSHYEAGQRLAYALPQAISIDNYLEVHSEDAEVVHVGRLSIAASIMEAERGSSLKNLIPSRRELSFATFEKTWLNVFFKMLSENVHRKDVESIFDSVAIITFNYDRCIEHYLVIALASYYNITLEYSQEICKTLNIQHPYGKIGALEWQDEDVKNPFGTAPSQHNLKAIARRIRTFSERMDDDRQMDRLHQTIEQAEQLVYLGFSFGKMNMDLLTIFGKEPKRVYGTSYGLSDPNVRSISGMVQSSLGVAWNHTIEFGPFKCHEFLENYWSPILA